jgi:hypothetical protein
MSATYRHTQINFLYTLLLVALLFVTIAVVVSTHFGLEAMILFILTAAVLSNYLTQTVEVRLDRVEVRFGPGLIRRSIGLERIFNLCVAEVSPEERLGVRLLSSGWLYRMGGKKAVEIILEDDTQLRIGTDEPVELARAIEKALIEWRKK